ncbi:AGAP006364-PD-like protein [Anopheles sinensis]|uniref:AGAP006364-PD-like protein n=1 Tax=Anopheles sinensis TaxID=74873 RepID=A0A084WEJ3_ANOSI|nr:AGAP006364-PD-like protein [Anopheles sinensis]
MTDEDAHTARPGAKKKPKKYPRECTDHVDLFRWLKGLGWANETALRIARYEHSGKGLFSRKPIDAGDCLISLPFEAMIGLNALERDAEFRAMFDELALEEHLSEEKLPFQALLAFYLCAQEHRKEPQYAAYFQSVPACFTNPYFCTKQELSLLPYFCPAANGGTK